MASIKVASPNDLLLFLLSKLIPEFSSAKRREVIQELHRFIAKDWKSKSVPIRIRGNHGNE
jgi:hypothetical protein